MKQRGLDTDLYKKEQLLADFDQLVTAFKTQHPKTFTNLCEFERVCLLQRDKVAEMSEYDFFKIIAPVVGKMHCGHTYILYSSEQEANSARNGNVLPLNVKVVDQAVYVMNSLPSLNLQKGSRIHCINGQKITDIIEQIVNTSTSDGTNKIAKQAKLNSECGSYSLHSGSFKIAYYVFIASPEEFNVTYSNPYSEQLFETVIAPEAYVPLAFNQQPLSFNFQKNHAILTIPNFYTYQQAQFKVFSDELSFFFDELKKKGIENLILDVRGNGGGDPNAGKLLLTYLLLSQFQYFNHDVTGTYSPLTQQSQINKNAFNGKLVILIDGLGFSTTGHLLSHLVDQNRGTLIGQESGGGYICNDRSKITRLSNTDIDINLPRFGFSTPVKRQTKGRGIIPDICLKYKIEDYLQHRDLEMQAALYQL